MPETYWEWRHEFLAHPDGRATGGEACVVCTEPVPSNAHWQHRDRHVCSRRCNLTLARRFTRRRDRGELGIPPTDIDPYRHRPPLVFGTDLSLPFPYGFLGLSPRHGDAVVRHGSVVLFERHLPSPDAIAEVERLAATDDDPRTSEWRRDVLRRSIVVHHVATGSSLVAAVDDNGTLGRAVHHCTGPDGEPHGFTAPFEDAQRRRWKWQVETIRHAEDDGRDYSWHAYVCLPEPPPDPWQSRMWTEEYYERSRRLRRVSAHTAAHARRQRMYGPDGDIERIDPVDIFRRDGWTCRLCGEPIDPNLWWPDLRSASLDHIVPLAALGSHTASNVQASHLGCNIRKGSRR